MNLFEKQLTSYKEQLRILKYSSCTITAYLMHTVFFLDWIIEKHIYDIKEVTKDHIREYQSLLMSELDKRYSMHTIHLKIRSVRRYFRYLEETKVLLYNPAETMILPAFKDKLSKNIFTEQEMKKLLSAPNTESYTGIRDRALLELLYSTGVRREECSNLMLTDIDYKGGYVRVNNGKGGKDRVLPLGKTACDWLKEYLFRVRQRFVRANPESRSFFISIFGKPLSAQSINLVVRRAAKKAGLSKPGSTHAVRRSLATHMLKNDAHPLYIQRMLGHSSIRTMTKYIKVAGVDIKKTHKKTHPREKDSIRDHRSYGARKK